MMLGGAAAQVSYAQPSSSWAFDSRTLFVGALANYYHAAGAKPHVGGCHGLHYPGWEPYSCNQTGQGLWLAAKDFEDASGKVWSHKVAHAGYRNTGSGEVFPQNIELITKREQPLVFVDGLESFKYLTFPDEVDPSIPSDGMVVNTVDAVNGLTLERRVYGFQNSYHDNYHIIEYIITNNTGNVTTDQGETPPEQPLEDVYLFQQRNYEIDQQAAAIVGNGGGWGRNKVNDVAEQHELADYDPDLRAQYAWLGYEPSFDRWNNIGGPVLDDNYSVLFEGDSLGRLTAAQMVGFATLHADESASSEADDPSQPSVQGFMSNGDDLTSNSAFNEEKMAREYDLLQGNRVGSAQPGSHADFITGGPASEPESVQAWRERMANQTADPGVDIEGIIAYTAYGPYDLAPGESVRIVQAEGVAGLSPEARFEIGREFKALHQAGNPDGEIGYDADGDGQVEADEQMSKNEWVMTARDSLYQMFAKADAAFDSGYDVPQPPAPPSEFRVASGANEIQISWTTYNGESPPVGFELYRGAERIVGDVTKAQGYELIAGPDELGPGARSYTDSDVQRGIGYYYYIRAVGEETATAELGVPAGTQLRSSRAFTQTYSPAILKRPPGQTLSDVRVVPNPFVLSSDREVRWPDQRDRLGFLNVPGQATIKIYTEAGILVDTIEHTDGSGDAYWNHTTSSNQLVASGVYAAVIINEETGDQVIKRFVIIR